MAVQTTALGFRIPDGNELARNGDNDIATNGQKAQHYLANVLARLGVAEANIQAGMGGGPGLTEDPLNPGTYFMSDDSPIIEDPENPGLYTF